MADGTHINWTDATWQVITGCDILSPGCTNCYAMRYAGTRGKHLKTRKGLTAMTKNGPVWNGEVRFNEELLDQPLHWRKPRLIFTVAHGDLFYERVPLAWIVKVLAVAALCPQHIFQLLTKRAERMAWVLLDPATRLAVADEVAARAAHAAIPHGMTWDRAHDISREIAIGTGWPLSNVWAGFSAEDQKHFDERMRHAERLARAGWLTWLSAEPLLGPIDFDGMWVDHPDPGMHTNMLESLKLVVSGGESKQNKAGRPCHPDNHRRLRDQCQALGVPYNFKQWGDWMPIDQWSPGPPFAPEIAIMPDGSQAPHDAVPQDVGGQRMRRVGTKRAGRMLDGRTWDEMPADRS